MKTRDLSYPVEIIREEDGAGYYAMVPSLPGCFSQGRTIEAAKKNITKAIKLHLRELKKAKLSAPHPVESYRTTVLVA